MNKNIRDVELMARAVLKDEELMRTIEDIRMEEIDRKIQLGTAYQEGMENGKKEKTQKTAKEMKKLNMSIEQIAQITGLSKEEVEKL